MNTSPPTLKDVAAAAGVSISTASRALAGNPVIAERTRERVRRCAEELNYRPNPQARALRSARTNIIGVALPSLVNPFFARMAHAIQQEAADNHLCTIISSTAEDTKQLHYSLDVLANQRVDGILAVPHPGSEASFDKLAHARIPVVLMDRELPGAGLPTVASDPRPGMDAAVAHLVGNGHRRIGYLPGPANASTAAGRLAAFEEACGKYGVDKREIHRGDAMELLERGVDAVIAGDTTISLAALETFHTHKVAVGQDLAFIGFDDNLIMRLQAHPVSVIDQDVDNLGRTALNLLIALIADAGAPESITTPTSLIIRPSSDFRRPPT